jgi:hypothetical protein
MGAILNLTDGFLFGKSFKGLDRKLKLSVA